MLKLNYFKNYINIYFSIFFIFFILFIINNFSIFFFYMEDLFFFFTNALYLNKINFITELKFDFFNYPFFLLFFFFFSLTSFLSLIFLNYLSLYGVFFSNFISLIFLFFSTLIYAKNIFFNDCYYYIKLNNWFLLSSNYKIELDFLIDNVSLSFSLLTISIAIFVYIYTFSYFRYEPLTDRLLIFLNLFIISMVFLVYSANLVSLFLGWEMIGITSFLLINFWSTRIGTFKSAFKAFSFNKFSDLFLFFSILLIYNSLFSTNILTILNQNALLFDTYLNFFFLKINYNDLICFFFCLCAFIKSAQIGFHVWLPDSMEAPVPASSLIHSATLVSAGIYLLLRFNLFFENSVYSLYFISFIGSVTAFYGGLSSALQSDTKKILAYSTISHCGFLMVVYTTGILEYVIIYLYIHGFFKAAIFMCAGNVNRLSKNNQDFRKMGIYYKYIPFECFLIFIGLINLSGLPFTLGFYIKHSLLSSLNNNFLLYYLIYVNCFLAALTGIFYSFRLIYYVFFDFKKSKKRLYLYYSSKFLNSVYYSNTTLASNISIIFIFFLSYLLSYYILNKSIFYYNFFSSFYSYNSFSLELNLNYTNLLNLYNFSYLNFFFVFLIIFNNFSLWRKNIAKFGYLSNFSNLVFFSFFFFLFNF